MVGRAPFQTLFRLTLMNHVKMCFRMNETYEASNQDMHIVNSCN